MQIMKKITPFLIIFVIVGIIVALFLSLGSTQKMIVIKEGNLKQVPLKMELNKCQDSFCGMVITDLTYASQVIAPDGKTWFFHDHGDFIEWLKDKPFAKEAVIWVMSRDTNRWIDARKAYYSTNEITPMEYGFGAYEKNRKGFIDFETMKIRTLRGETMKNPKLYKQLRDK